MRILTIHNKYKIRGGEDEARESEDKLLSSRGHVVEEFVLDNSVIGQENQLKVGFLATWNQSAYDAVRQKIKAFRPNVVDVHNFFPLASPAVHHAAKSLGVAVAQTLHNYRLLCPGAIFFRDGHVCEDCTKHVLPWPGVVHGCYHGSALQTGAVALMVAAHRMLRTWRRAVSVFFISTEFGKRKFVENGFPASKIVVKPNFILDPGPQPAERSGFLFAGRLTGDKGVNTLLGAMKHLGADIRLSIIGEGPLRPTVEAAASNDSRITYLGKLPQREVLRAMGAAKCVVVASEWYETFGRVAAEAFACGTPVITSSIGALAEVVEDGRTGLHFPPGDAEGLARAIDYINRNPNAVAAMQRAARSEYESKYTPERNYQLLLQAYAQAGAAIE